MKELSLEQKAQRYDKALKRAREWYNDPHITIGLKGNLEDIFPELVESEDERIRRCIRMCLTDVDEQRFKNFNTNLKDCLNWLEKQGQKPIAIDIDKMVDDYANNNEPGNERFGKPIKCMIRAYRQGLNDAYCQANCKGYQETGRCFADGECEAKKKAESCWSEKDKKMLRCIGNAITVDDASMYLESKGIQVIDAHVWLDELKERVQPKQEWSEDDKRIFSEIILRCEKYGNQEQIDWLKSLKEKYAWKPSDEQIEAVKSAALDIAKFSSRSEQLRLENEPYYKALVSLYKDLQKLRE